MPGLRLIGVPASSSMILRLWETEMPFIERQGIKLHYEDAGQGHPLLFVHEFGSDAREWEQQVRALSRHYRCITFNARGYPPSDVPDDPALYGWQFARDDIAAVMDGLGLAK